MLDLAHQDRLERRYDGPIPPADPAACRVAAPLRARLFDRLAGETVRQTARRRARVRACHVAADGRLKTLERTLGAYRAHGVAWHGAT